MIFSLLTRNAARIRKNNSNLNTIIRNKNDILLVRMSSATAAASTTKGRKRFYKHVGIMEIDNAPWESQEQKDEKETTVSSPISAGVDGTQSASGVGNVLPSSSELKQRLLPTSSSNENKSKWYGVSLDGRLIKTPLGQTLSIPSAEIAAVIASEWDAQQNILNPSQMPCMTLACTTLDQTAGASDKVITECLSYLNHDTACFQADPLEDRVLHRNQIEAWDGLYDFIETRFGAEPAIAIGSQDGLMLSRRGGLPHPPALKESIKSYLTNDLNAWQLTALRSIITEAKSCIVGLAFANAFWNGNAEKVINACRIEEEFQIEVWGCVEGQHDYDRLNCRIQILSAALFLNSLK